MIELGKKLRWAFGGVAIALSLVAGPTCARADDDDFKSLMADCSRSDLPYSDIKDCMERARVMDVDNPSPQLQRLLTKLERQLEAGDNSQDPSAQPAATGTPRALSGASNHTISVPLVAYRTNAKENADDPPQEFDADDANPPDESDEHAARGSIPHG